MCKFYYISYITIALWVYLSNCGHTYVSYSINTLQRRKWMEEVGNIGEKIWEEFRYKVSPSPPVLPSFQRRHQLDLQTAVTVYTAAVTSHPKWKWFSIVVRLLLNPDWLVMVGEVAPCMYLCNTTTTSGSTGLLLILLFIFIYLTKFMECPHFIVFLRICQKKVATTKATITRTI